MEKTIIEAIHKRTLNEGLIGPFYYIDGEVYSDATSIRAGEEYGDFVTYGSHWDFFNDEIVEYIPNATSHDYDFYPRGRSVFNTADRKFHLYVPDNFSDSQIADVMGEFALSRTNTVVHKEDEHYSSRPRESYYSAR